MNARTRAILRALDTEIEQIKALNTSITDIQLRTENEDYILYLQHCQFRRTISPDVLRIAATHMSPSSLTHKMARRINV